MRTPKELYPDERIIYHPELSSCPNCGGSLVKDNYLCWDKIVQTLDGVLSVASRPAHCSDSGCVGHTMRVVSAQAQQLALPGSTYGLDVLVRIGWLRQERHATFSEIKEELSGKVAISHSYVHHLYHNVYLPLLACQERTHWERLTEVSQEYGGLIIALDGLAPEGGEAQLWFIRELLTGLTLRSGWLGQQDHKTFEALLSPLSQLELPILAVLSDKQRGLVPAVASELPQSRHQFCQAHYLRNLAQPLSEADSSFNVELRKAVRQRLGELIRAEGSEETSQRGVLSVTGLLPDHPQQQQDENQAESGEAEDTGADEVVSHLLRHTRYLLTLKGRAPLRLAGIETYERLEGVAGLSAELLAHRYDARLDQLYEGLKAGLDPLSSQYHQLEQGAGWLGDIADILKVADDMPTSAQRVALKLQVYMDDLYELEGLSAAQQSFRHHLHKVSASYWPGLFHCYDIEGLPRTNNELESHFRDTQRRLLRTNGQKGQSRRALQRYGAWELLPRGANEGEQLAAMRQVPVAQLETEQRRFRQHRQRFRLHTRSMRRVQAQLDGLRQQWIALAATSTG